MSEIISNEKTIISNEKDEKVEEKENEENENEEKENKEKEKENEEKQNKEKENEENENENEENEKNVLSMEKNQEKNIIKENIIIKEEEIKNENKNIQNEEKENINEISDIKDNREIINKKVLNSKEKEKEIEEEDKKDEKEEEEEIIEKEAETHLKIEEKKIKKLHMNPDFENNIMDAYKKLSKTIKEEEEENNIKSVNLNLKYCEKKLRTALKICRYDKNLIINRNIIDKLSRLSLHNKMNLNYVIGDIYISLMNKDFLFDYDDENFEINDLLIFVNKVIQFKDIMNNTKIGVTYHNSLKRFLFNITQKFDLDEDQLNCIKFVLEENKEIDHTNILTSSFGDLIYSLSIELEKQPNIYEQYKIFIQNKLSIIKLIDNCNIEDKRNYENYLRLGKYLAYLFYNKTFSLYLQNNNNNNENNDDVDAFRHFMFDGYESKGEINVINSEKFYVFEENRINEYREKLCEIIFKYIEKFLEMVDIFSIQYIIYILIKRIYFYHYDKYKKTINSLLADSLINMCFFKNSPLGLISNFINIILKSTKNEDKELKYLLFGNINLAIKENNFLYRLPKSFNIKKEKKEKKDKKEDKDIFEDEDKEEDEKEEKKEKKDKEDEVEKNKKKDENDEGEEDEEDEDEDEEENNEKELNNINDEIMLMYHNDLKIGFLNYKIINAGEKFIFYEEINQEYGVLDFCLYLYDLDIKFTITDLTEGREIFTKERLNSAFETPLKIIMLFTSPRILQFEFDNSYSWLKHKAIKYKTNIFYPKYPYTIGHQILISKYQKTIIQTKNKLLKNKKNAKSKKKLLKMMDIDY